MSPDDLTWNRCSNMLEICMGTKQSGKGHSYKTRFSESPFSEILDLVNELQLPFFIFYTLPRLDLVNRLTRFSE